MKRNIQLPYELFMALIKFHLFQDDDYADEIQTSLEQKKPYGETCRVSGVALGERKTCLQVAFLMALLSKVLLLYS